MCTPVTAAVQICRRETHSNCSVCTESEEWATLVGGTRLHARRLDPPGRGDRCSTYQPTIYELTTYKLPTYKLPTYKLTTYKLTTYRCDGCYWPAATGPLLLARCHLSADVTRTAFLQVTRTACSLGARDAFRSMEL